jgi:hypothetical protein
MRTVRRLMLTLSFMVPFASQAAQQWSGCQTIVGVSNYMAYNNDNLIILVLSPGLPDCNYNGVTGAIGFSAGSFGVTTTNISTFLAGFFTAYSTGRQVMIYYDTATCFGIIVSNGGYEGQCP